jgi:hypothetical protein
MPFSFTFDLPTVTQYFAYLVLWKKKVSKGPILEILHITWHKIKMLSSFLRFKTIKAGSPCNMDIPIDVYVFCRNHSAVSKKMQLTIRYNYFAVERKFILFVVAPFSLLHCVQQLIYKQIQLHVTSYPTVLLQSLSRYGFELFLLLCKFLKYWVLATRIMQRYKY